MNARVVAACVCLPLLVISVRMYKEADAALTQSEQLADRGDLEAQKERVRLLGKAARRAMPWGPSCRAREQLAALGRRNVDGAWVELRSAILATRSFYTPSPELLSEANGAIATAQAADELGERANKGTPIIAAQLAETRRPYLAQLERTSEPSRVYTGLALIGLAMFLTGAARVLWFGVRRRELMFTTLGFCSLLIGLWRA